MVFKIGEYMSRSYNHHPHCQVVKRDNEFKKIYNKKLRRTDVLDDIDNRPASYKKLNESWRIDDWSDTESFEKFWNKGKRYCSEWKECPGLSMDNCRKCWEKWYKRK